MKQSQTKELLNQLSSAFSALIKYLWIKHKPSKNSLISSFWYLIFLIVNGSIIAGLAFLFLKSDPDMAKLIISTKQDSSTSSFWGVVAAIGSLLAGLGTVGLLVFGWVKGDSWIKQERFRRQLDDLNALLAEAAKLQSTFGEIANIRNISNYEMDWYTKSQALIPSIQNYIYVCDNLRIEINRRWNLDLESMDLDDLVKCLQTFDMPNFSKKIRPHFEEWKSAIVETTNKLL